MPEYAELFAHLPCPRCGREVVQGDYKIKFQWGRIPEGYVIGEEIRWNKGWFGRMRWRVGDPRIADVLVVDADVNLTTWICNGCGALLDKPCVEIRGGKIKGVWVFERGEFLLRAGCSQEVADCYELRASGEITPLPAFDLA